MFIAGGCAAAFLLPEKIVTKREVVTVLAERYIVAKQHSVTQRVVSPQGEIRETITVTTDASSREAASLNEVIETTTHTNPKKFLVYAGLGSSLQHFTPIVQGGIMATLWGPITLGGYADSEGTLGATVGFRW